MFNCKGKTIIVVTDIKCDMYDEKKEVSVKKYSLGKIINDDLEYCIVKLDDDKVVKISKKYIAINLCEVMQKEVIYSIVNADKAIYHIHGNEIPKVTGKKLYPNDTLNGNLFVPLMFNSASKLFKAEEEFLKRGLTIKIYDAFRPYAVTRYLYNILLDLTDKYYDFLNGEVSGHKYDQTDFLAAKTSTHNYCIALDMTLVNLETGKELEMQTSMHDLSIYSVTDYNNDNANMFAKVMSECGFFPLESEWWHFQDNDSKVDFLNFYITDNGEIREYESEITSI